MTVEKLRRILALCPGSAVICVGLEGVIYETDDTVEFRSDQRRLVVTPEARLTVMPGYVEGT